MMFADPLRLVVAAYLTRFKARYLWVA